MAGIKFSARFVGGWGFNPSGASQPPKFVFNPPQKKVKISQKYIDDPPLVFPQIEY